MDWSNAYNVYQAANYIEGGHYFASEHKPRDGGLYLREGASCMALAFRLSRKHKRQLKEEGLTDPR